MSSGGKRKGAGRKPAPNKKKQYATRLKQSTIAFLQTIKPAAPWLEDAIEEKRNKKNLLIEVNNEF